MRIWRWPVILGAVLVVTAVGMRGAAPVEAQGLGCAVNPSEMAIDTEEQSAIDAINTLRAAGGASPLQVSSALGQSAAWKSVSMAATGYLSHDDNGRSWLQRIRECGYGATSTPTENIAMGVDTGQAVVQMWRSSAAHHRNLMDGSMRAVGLARARGAGGWFWTAVFGAAADGPTPERSTPAPAVSNAPVRSGGSAIVAAGQGDCLNVRAAPSKSATIVTCLADGATVRITDGPRTADGETWWLLDGLGWASGTWLRGQT